MNDPLHEFAERARAMHDLTRDFEAACNRAIDRLTPEREREQPGLRLELFRKRKAARELLVEFERLNIDCLMVAIERHVVRMEGRCPDDATTR